MAASASDRRSSGFVLFLWFFTTFLELGGVVWIYAVMPDVSGDAVFGSPATQLVVAYVLAAALAGVVAAWRGVSGTPRLVVACALAVATGLTVAVALGLATAGILAVLLVLVAHSVVSLALITRAVLRSAPAKGV